MDGKEAPSPSLAGEALPRAPPIFPAPIAGEPPARLPLLDSGMTTSGTRVLIDLESGDYVDDGAVGGRVLLPISAALDAAVSPAGQKMIAPALAPLLLVAHRNGRSPHPNGAAHAFLYFDPGSSERPALFLSIPVSARTPSKEALRLPGVEINATLISRSQNVLQAIDAQRDVEHPVTSIIRVYGRGSEAVTILRLCPKPMLYSTAHARPVEDRNAYLVATGVLSPRVTFAQAAEIKKDEDQAGVLSVPVRAAIVVGQDYVDAVLIYFDTTDRDTYKLRSDAVLQSGTAGRSSDAGASDVGASGGAGGGAGGAGGGPASDGRAAGAAADDGAMVDDVAPQRKGKIRLIYTGTATTSRLLERLQCSGISVSEQQDHAMQSMPLLNDIRADNLDTTGAALLDALTTGGARPPPAVPAPAPAFASAGGDRDGACPAPRPHATAPASGTDSVLAAGGLNDSLDALLASLDDSDFAPVATAAPYPPPAAASAPPEPPSPCTKQRDFSPR